MRNHLGAETTRTLYHIGKGERKLTHNRHKQKKKTTPIKN